MTFKRTACIILVVPPPASFYSIDNLENEIPTLKYLKKEGLDKWKAPEGMHRNFPYYLSGFDEDNRPIWVMEFGKWDVRGVVEKGGQDLKDLEKYMDQWVYRMMESLKIKSGPDNLVDEVIIIFDMDNYTLLQLNSIPAVAFLLKKIQQLRDAMNFVETGYVVNGLSLIVGVVCIVVGVLVVLFFQNLIDAFIKSELPLRKGSEPFELWRKPPVTPLLKVWFFNVTNADEFLNNGTKLRVQEKGPYVYSEKWEKVGVEWHPNGTLSYRQTKLFYFEPSLSMGAENDTFLLPNVPMLSAVGQMSHSTKIVKNAIATLLDILKLQPFTSHTVKELMWGYEDPLIKLGKQVLPAGKRVPYDQFGFFVDKNNTESKVYTVFSGQDDLKDFARIDVYNGNKNLEFWGTDSCNMINGTDATGFPSSLTNDSDIYIFQPDLCRSLHLRYNATVHHQGLPGFRFMPTASTFGDVETYPENECFCLGGPPCSKKGLFNISTCQFGSPIFVSFPHFLHADPSLLEDVEGLQPDPLRHQFYIDIQPKLGIAMQAKGRVQINIQMSRVEGIPQTASLQNVLIPVLWFEDGIDELPPKITALINQAIHTPEIAKNALSYVTFILGGLLLLCGIMYSIRSSYTRKETMSNGHAKGDMEKSSYGVKNGQFALKNTGETDDNLKHQNGRSKETVIETTLNQKTGEGDS